jgi:phospholipid-binding lipoprotein MlaA
MRRILIFASCIFLVIGLHGRILAADKAEYPDLLQDEYLEDDYDKGDGYGGKVDIYDPLEPLNRVFFVFNDKLYFWVLKPAKTGYSYVVPSDFRQCFRNFFNNLLSPIRLVNNVLQGRIEDAGVVFSRLLINSTIGVLGLADAASTEFGLEPRYADFGQTLGLYGVGEGIYINWPVLGSSHVRSSFGFVGDTLANPVSYIDMTIAQRSAYTVVKRVNSLSLRPATYEDLVKYSLDPYVTVRQSFYDFRRNVVKNKGEDSFD